jgi:hypothetical protein
MERTFNVIKIKSTYGRLKTDEVLATLLTHKIPVGAAKKAASKACLENSITGRCTFIVTVKEVGGENKEFSYKVSRVSNPTTVTHGDKEVKYKYMMKATALK